jgi:hypothetical protein
MMQSIKQFFIAFAFASSSVFAADAQLLMYAAKLNFMKAVEGRCAQVVPGYSRDFELAYAKAKIKFFDQVGITAELMAEASTIPELEISSLIRKFDYSEIELKKTYCKQNLQELSFVANSEIETVPKR